MKPNSYLSQNDVLNLLALCEQENTDYAGKFAFRCKKTLADRNVDIHILQTDINFLKNLYDPDMDADAKRTIEKILERKKSC